MIYENTDKFIENTPLKYGVFSNGKQKYIRVAAGFDIETTRIDKEAYMYHWQLCFNDNILLARTWKEFQKIIDFLNETGEQHKAKIIVWVANLSHEFAFLQNRLKWSKIFAREARKPITATTGNIEFRDCLMLSGQGGLANLAKNYCKTRKLKGDLDYNILRNSRTVLTDKEKQYCINDVQILKEWSDYCFNRWVDNGEKIPLTSTGIVRNMVKKEMETNKNRISWAISQMFPKNADEYNFIFRFLFRGGFTHSNIFHTNETLENIIGVDFTSSYPAVMLHEKYPSTPFDDITLKADGVHITDNRMENCAVWFVAKFYNIKTTTFHSIESKHKIIDFSENAVFDNGRLCKSDYIEVALTNVDYAVYKMFYKWDKIEIVKAKCSQMAVLPDYLLKPLKESYQTKQRLKQNGLDGTVEYKNAKAAVNSYYGMTVTRLNFEEWDYINGKWESIPTFDNYASTKTKQFLNPYWGIWVTAYARYNLLSVVYKIGNDAVYCDTDSIYFFDTPENRKIIDKYNKNIFEQNTTFPIEFSDIGAFDYIDKCAHYTFKTLGAKRYMKARLTGYGYKIETTVAGMRKGTFEEKVIHEPINGKFERFENDLILDMTESCKNTVCYNDSEHFAEIDGEIMHEYSSAVIYPIEFHLRMDEIYLILIEKIRNERRRLAHD